MTDATTTPASGTGMPYTLESADFLNNVRQAVQTAKNNMATIDSDIDALTAKFRADVMSRQARKADLQIIIAHGEGVLGRVEEVAKSVEGWFTSDVKAIEAGVGSELAKLVDGLRGTAQEAPPSDDNTIAATPPVSVP